jgi:hypothetical protein
MVVEKGIVRLAKEEAHKLFMVKLLWALKLERKANGVIN